MRASTLRSAAEKLLGVLQIPAETLDGGLEAGQRVPIGGTLAEQHVVAHRDQRILRVAGGK